MSVRTTAEAVGAAADAAAAEHHRALQEWLTSDRPGSEREAPPAWPADRLKAVVQVLVSDDIGTHYAFSSGASGGEGTAWVVLHRYLPAPPPRATVLRLRLVIAGQPDVEAGVPLTRA